MMGAYSSVKRAGREIVLANATDRICDLLRVTQLYRVFEVHESHDAAFARLATQSDTPKP